MILKKNNNAAVATIIEFIVNFYFLVLYCKNPSKYKLNNAEEPFYSAYKRVKPGNF